MNDIDTVALERKLRDWFVRPPVRGGGWSPRLFWKPSPDGKAFGALRVDAMELEVFLAALLGEVPECSETLDALRPGRSVFLASNARRHELPFFTPR